MIQMASDYKSQNYVMRFLMIDHQQNTFNQIKQALDNRHYTAQGRLLDDFNTFEKLMNLSWDAIIFHHAYDFDYEQVLKLTKDKEKPIPIILLNDDIDPKSSEAMEFYRKGIYEITNKQNLDYLALVLHRASSYSSLLRQKFHLVQEIDKLRQQSQSLVQNTDYAIALFHEGVHVSANEQYLELFGFDDEDDVIGLPILDVLKPQDATAFKQQFKRINKGDFGHSPFTIICENEACEGQQLSLQFSQTQFEDDTVLQLVVMNDVDELTEDNDAEEKPQQPSVERNIVTQTNAILNQRQLAAVALFSVNHIPDGLLSAGWRDYDDYLTAIEQKISDTTHHPVFRISAQSLAAIFAVKSPQTLNDQLLPQLDGILPENVHINHKQYTVDLHLSGTVIQHQITEEDFHSVMNTAFANPYAPVIIQATKESKTVEAEKPAPKAPEFQLDEPAKPAVEEAKPDIKLSMAGDDYMTDINSEPVSNKKEAASAYNSLSLSDMSVVDIDSSYVPLEGKGAMGKVKPVGKTPSLGNLTAAGAAETENPFAPKKAAEIQAASNLQHILVEHITNNTVELLYQQVYDKEDIDTHIYEVTAQFEADGKKITLDDFDELDSNPELAIKVNRWILVEAAKHLHNYLVKQPKAKIMVKLNAVCFEDSSISSLLSKLVHLINSRYTDALILQFKEVDFLRHMDDAMNFIKTVREYGIAVAVNEFGTSAHSKTILKQLDLQYAKLAAEYSKKLLSDDGLVELQEELDGLHENNADVKFIIGGLNDMTSFANTWNVDVRYLVGDYFQAKQTEFIDSVGG